jgi:hypothetical protein
MYNPLPMQTTAIKKLLWFAFYSLPFFAFIARGSETRPAIVSPQGAKDSSAPFKAAFPIGHRAQLATVTRASANPSGSRGGKPTAQEVVKGYVRMEAVEHKVDPQLALWIVKHESHFNPRAKGDGEASRGLWQISKIYHPEVSDAQAFNVASSTEWSLERIRSGKAYEWSTYRYCRTLYDDCPFK